MRILLASHYYAPSVGGIETVSRLLATEFLKLGHEVRVVTLTAGVQEGEFPVIRLVRGRGHFQEMLHQLDWCDVFFQNQIGLHTLAPWFLKRKPLVIASHTWLAPSARSPMSWLKRKCLSAAARRVYVSQAFQDSVGLEGVVIYNPYDISVFHDDPSILAEDRLIFVGRLVPGKGADLLLRALWLLKKEGILLPLTIVGSGPEEGVLKSLCVEWGLTAQVEFRGKLVGVALAQELARHRVMVMPSLWEEPFGLVAVEAIACGCVVVASQGGGAPEAVGPCGVTFPNGDAEALKECFVEWVRHPEKWEKFRAAAQGHLALFHPAVSAAKYLDLFASACGQ